MKVSNSSRLQFTSFERYVGSMNKVSDIKQSFARAGDQHVIIRKIGDQIYIATEWQGQLLKQAESISKKTQRMNKESSPGVSLEGTMLAATKVYGGLWEYFIRLLELS